MKNLYFDMLNFYDLTAITKRTVSKIEKMTIGKLAKKAEVNVETIRYYEREGLISEPPRNKSGYRQYSPKELDCLKFIKSAQKLGFSLNEISELLSLKINSDTVCEDVKLMAEEKIKIVEEKIKTLEDMKEILAKLINSCQSNRPTGDCPILEAIKNEL